MYCKNCGTALKENQKFCPKCGSPVNIAETTVSPAQIVQGQTGKRSHKGIVICVIVICVVALLATGISFLIPALKARTAKERKAKTWVLIQETRTSADSDDESPDCTEYYRYDSEGNIISIEKHAEEYTEKSISVKNDDSGKILSRTDEIHYMPDTYLEDDIIDKTYQYDQKGRCIVEEWNWRSSGTKDRTEYKYDDFDNVIEKYVHTDYKESEWDYTETETRKLTYEDGKCIQAEVISKSGDEYSSDRYSIERYSYDENGNLKEILYYNEADDTDNVNEQITVGGRNYKPWYKMQYTYAQLGDVAVDADKN